MSGISHDKSEVCPHQHRKSHSYQQSYRSLNIFRGGLHLLQLGAIRHVSRNVGNMQLPVYRRWSQYGSSTKLQRRELLLKKQVKSTNASDKGTGDGCRGDPKHPGHQQKRRARSQNCDIEANIEPGTLQYSRTPTRTH